MFKLRSTRMLICDMAGTTVQEKGIVYNSLFNTIKLIKPNLIKSEISKFSGYNKNEVIKYYVDKQKMDSPIIVLNNLKSEFNYYLKKEYSNNNSVNLIHPNLPLFFNLLREQDIKICLNTGYNKDIQNLLIDKLNLLDCIDDYISSEEVDRGRPYPYMIERLMFRNNIEYPQEVIKIGDSIADINEGKNAGCKTVGVLSGAGSKVQLKKEKPDFIINNIMDLKFN
jgi:phosphonatase-like hydrolase